MGEAVEDKCGFVLAYSLHDAYAMLRDLQHRGREAAGLAAIADGRIDVLKWVGKVSRFDREDLHRIFPRSDYHTFLGHVRYATSGHKDLVDILQHAHPHTVGGTVFDRGDHIIIQDCDAAMVHNGQVSMDALDDIVGRDFQCDTAALLQYYLEEGERHLLRNVPGAYTLAVADKHKREVMVLRDGSGIRVGVLGMKDGKHCFASEDVAIRKNGGRRLNDITPGAVYYFDSNGNIRRTQVLTPESLQIRHCMFEYLYLSSPESVVNGASVQHVRTLLGARMAQEFHPEGIDFVTYVPRSPEAAAIRYAEELGVPFVDVFYKPSAQRSFMGSTQEDREASISSNLYLIPEAIAKIRGKRGIVIEDSIVRGTVGSRVRELLFDQAQVRDATLFSYTPQIGIVGDDGVDRGCTFGVDMPPTDSFVARIDGRNASSAEINAAVGMPVVYLSREGLYSVFIQAGLAAGNLCSFCIGGEMPY